MLTISKPLSGGQARTYLAREFAAKEANYWSREQQGHSAWQGELAQKWGLRGAVGAEQFARLTEGQHPDTGENKLYVLDESLLASTKQMHDFVSRLHPNDCVLLVGDTRQHEVVEAGRPFAQLQEAGMETVKLDEIVRQRDPELKNVVEQLARGKVGAAVQGLERQGRVHEVKDPAADDIPAHRPPGPRHGRTRTDSGPLGPGAVLRQEPQGFQRLLHL